MTDTIHVQGHNDSGWSRSLQRMSIALKSARSVAHVMGRLYSTCTVLGH